MKHDRHVVGTEAPESVLVRAQLAEVQAISIDVIDAVAELARAGELLEFLHARVVLEQVTHHQHAPTGAGGLHRALGVRH